MNNDCRLYGPIPREPSDDAIMKRLRRAAEDGIRNLQQEDPETYKRLCALVESLAKGKS